MLGEIKLEVYGPDRCAKKALEQQAVCLSTNPRSCVRATPTAMSVAPLPASDLPQSVDDYDRLEENFRNKE